MIHVRSKKDLEVTLSKALNFKNAKVSSEQYVTPSGIAAEVLWKAYFNGHIEEKVIADLGCGTGVLGIGALLLGAKSVLFVDNDDKALQICRENIQKLQSERSGLGQVEFLEKDVASVDQRVDTVIMNPPFGTKKKHADKGFLKKAFSITKVTYSFHKSSTNDYIISLAQANKQNISEQFSFNYLLRNTMKHHTKEKEYIEVSCFVFER